MPSGAWIRAFPAMCAAQIERRTGNRCWNLKIVTILPETENRLVDLQGGRCFVVACPHAQQRIARGAAPIATERPLRGLSGKPSAEFPKTPCSFQQPGARAAHWRPARAQQPATSNTYVAPNRAPPGGHKPTGLAPGRLGLRCAALAGICAVLIAVLPPPHLRTRPFFVFTNLNNICS